MSSPDTHVDRRSAGYHFRHNGGLILTAIILASGFFMYGYDASVISGSLAMPLFIQHFGTATAKGYVLTAHQTSLVTAVPTVGTFLGAVIITLYSDRIGRKKIIWIACAIGVASSAIQTAAVNIVMFTVGRVFTATSCFLLQSSCATALVEMAPANIRGAVAVLGVFSIGIALIVSSGVNWATSTIMTDLSWRLPIGLQCLWPLLIAGGMIYVSDSPTSFLIAGEDEKAQQSLEKVRHGYTAEEIRSELDSLKWQAALRAAETEVPWLDLFRGVNLRRTFLATYLAIFDLLSGLVFATFYATVFLTQVGSSSPFELVFALDVLAIGGAILGLFLVDLVGRRVLALTTFSILFVIDVVIGGLGFADPTSSSVIKAISAFLLMFGFFCAAGFSSLTLLSAAEFPTARLRSRTNAFSLMSGSLASLAVIYILPYIASPNAGNLGAKTYLIFAGCMALCIVITFFCYPEVKGRTAAEIDEMFEARLPARKFKGYICSVSPDNLDTAMMKNVEELEIAGEQKV
ncbi:hypothetical protein BP6252_06579 [Coleophoma cylindrospora]|uniref:Major facilitator superfamily (MFS) profile domain-containing protein n=1 Tax=Coleophoma cylindrospora TaxID=1849047 RepID=A0A3D8RMZ3_9HELO|nr:hypothetical protein BP6252_06579 [Coleophoma cylindrospora]